MNFIDSPYYLPSQSDEIEYLKNKSLISYFIHSVYSFFETRKKTYIFISGVAVALSGLTYYLFYYNEEGNAELLFSERVEEYIKEIKRVAVKHNLIEDDASKNGNKINYDNNKKKYNEINIKKQQLPIEIIVLALLASKQIAEELFYEEYSMDRERKRIQLLKELQDDHNQDYYKEALDLLTIKDELLVKAFGILNKSFYFIEYDNIFNKLEKLKGKDVELFKELIKNYYIYKEPQEEENEEEYRYYSRLKQRVNSSINNTSENNNKNIIKDLFKVYFTLSLNLSDLITQKKIESKKVEIFYDKKNKKNFKEKLNEEVRLGIKKSNGAPAFNDETCKILLINHIILEDSIKQQFGIKLVDLVYLMRRSEAYSNNSELKMLVDNLEEKDKFIDFY